MNYTVLWSCKNYDTDYLFQQSVKHEHQMSLSSVPSENFSLYHGPTYVFWYFKKGKNIEVFLSKKLGLYWHVYCLLHWKFLHSLVGCMLSVTVSNFNAFPRGLEFGLLLSLNLVLLFVG